MVLLLATGCVGFGPRTAPRVSDGFEDGGVSAARWSRTWFVRRDGGVSTDEARYGAAGLQVTVHEGDRRLFGKSGQATERSEIIERDRVPLETDVWYRFSVFVPEDFPLVDVRLVMGQWKQSTITLWKKRSPVVAQRFRAGRLSITVNNDAGKHELYGSGGYTNPSLVGRWTDFVYHIRMSRDDSGFVQVWMDDSLVVDYSGQVGYADDLGTGYFRFGLYRDTTPEPMTVWFDGYTRTIGEQSRE